MIHFRLAEILLDMGISNKSEFARELEMNRWGITKLIQGEPKQMELLTIEKLCRALDVLPNDLFQILNENGTPFVPRVIGSYKPWHRKVSIDKVAAKMSAERKMALVKALIK